MRVLGSYPLRNGAMGANPNGAQCVNLANCFWESVGRGALSGNAGTWVGVENEWLRWIPLGHEVALNAGDVFVLADGPLTPEGHVGIVLDASRTPYMGAELNYPTGSPVQLCNRYRNDAAGFLRLK